MKAIGGPNEFNEFYKKFKDVKEFHRKHPDAVFIPMSMEFDEMDEARENPVDETNSKLFSLQYCELKQIFYCVIFNLLSI